MNVRWEGNFLISNNFPLHFPSFSSIINKIPVVVKLNKAYSFEASSPDKHITNILKSRMHRIIKSVSELRSGNNYNILWFYVIHKADRMNRYYKLVSNRCKTPKNILKFRVLYLVRLKIKLEIMANFKT